MDSVILVVPPGQETRCRTEILEPCGLTVDRLIPGGADRQASVYAGLAAGPAETDVVLVHDGARPLVTPEIVRAAVQVAATEGAAVVAIPVTDTIKMADADGRVVETPPRGRLWAAQTPQAFRAGWLREAHARALADGFRGTDDSSLVERIGHPVRLVPGSPENLKITTTADLVRAEQILRGRWRPMTRDPLPMRRADGSPASVMGVRSMGCRMIRVGVGFDMHRLVSGRPLILGGVAIPFERGLEGDSDADVLTHAILDALLGAAGLGDIGTHFGVGRPENMGISSLLLLERVVALLRARGYRAHNVDATVVAEAPKIGPFIPAMRATLAKVLGIPEDAGERQGNHGKGIGGAGGGRGDRDVCDRLASSPGVAPP